MKDTSAIAGRRFFLVGVTLLLLSRVGLTHALSSSSKTPSARTNCDSSTSLFSSRMDEVLDDSKGENIGDCSCSNSSISRRSLFGVGPAALVAGALVLGPSGPSMAAVTDETDSFADTWWSSKSSGSELSQRMEDKVVKIEPQKSQPLSKLPPQSGRSASDELYVTISKEDLAKEGGLGLELAEIEFRTNLRVYVKSVKPSSLASKLGIRKDFIVVSLNGKSTERTNAEGVTKMLSSVVKDPSRESIEFCFRDPSIFQEQLKNLSSEETATTQVAPAGDTTQRREDGSVKSGYSVSEQTDQKVTVSQLIKPKLCNRGAATDDLLEISYIGRVADTGAIFDGSAVKINNEGIPGRGDDVSIFFVLGKQPFGQFPPGWDVGLVGMCVGERRRLIIPPALAYGSTGVPRRGIPPDATLQYDVTLVSLNGLATPQ